MGKWFGRVASEGAELPLTSQPPVISIWMFQEVSYEVGQPQFRSQDL